MSLRDRLLQNTTIKETAMISDSVVLKDGDVIPTTVPMINVALSGRIDGGLTAGLTMLAGPSKHFKTGFALLMIKAFLTKHSDGIVLFYDSEFGTPQSYFEAFDINLNSIIHTPVTNIEELKSDFMNQLAGVDRKDRFMVVIDSVGNIASKKEVDDALEGSSKADMTRAKQLKSLFRMVTPHLRLKDIPLVVVNHTYKEQSLYPRDIVSGGTGAYYSSNNIWIIGRQQNKTGKEVDGYNFMIKVEKSRFVKENSKIPISVSWKGGINIYSGLLESALEHGCIEKTKPGWYVVNFSDSSQGTAKREKDLINNKNYWDAIFQGTDLADFIEKKYKMPDTKILGESDEANSV